jgi:H/ACA ribonucleoprotein complex subunit 2
LLRHYRRGDQDSEMGSDGEDEKKEKERERRKRLAVSPISKPLAGKKLTKKTLKVVKKAASSKQLKRGVKEVVKAIRKGQKGLVVIAGDISPIDVITHVPILCEDAGIPYIYVPSKEDLGAAGSTKRPTSCLLVMPVPPKGGVSEEDGAKFKASFDEVLTEVKAASVAIYA